MYNLEKKGVVKFFICILSKNRKYWKLRIHFSNTIFQESLDFKALVPEHCISEFNAFSLANPQHVSVKLHCLAPTLDCENFWRDWARLFDECHSENSISRKWVVILTTILPSENLGFICPIQKKKTSFETWNGKSHVVSNTRHWMHSERYQRKSDRGISSRMVSRNCLTHFDATDYI